MTQFLVAVYLKLAHNSSSNIINFILSNTFQFNNNQICTSPLVNEDINYDTMEFKLRIENKTIFNKVNANHSTFNFSKADVNKI